MKKERLTKLMAEYVGLQTMDTTRKGIRETMNCNCIAVVSCAIFLFSCNKDTEGEGKAGASTESLQEGDGCNLKGADDSWWRTKTSSELCDRRMLIEQRKKWYKDIEARDGNSWTGEMERISAGEYPPPIVCERECPFNIDPSVGIGKIPVADRKSAFADEKALADGGLPMEAGDIFGKKSKGDIWKLSTSELNLFDFPSNCLVFKGQAIPRTGCIRDIEKRFEDCKYDTSEGTTQIVCNHGAIVLGFSAFEGPSISLRKINQ